MSATTYVVLPFLSRIRSLLGDPYRYPRVLSLLFESYDPHVCYGAAMAMAVVCGGTGLKEARSLRRPILSDPVDAIRQGVLIAIAPTTLVQSLKSQVASFC